MKPLMIALLMVSTSLSQESKPASRPESRESRFENDYDAALADAKARGRPLLVAFIVSTDPNAKIVRFGLFDVVEPIKTLLKNFVLVTLTVDAGPAQHKNVAIMKRLGLGEGETPKYVVLDSTYSQCMVKWGLLAGDSSAWKARLGEALEAWKSASAAASRPSK